jgi:hypothetical protein
MGVRAHHGLVETIFLDPPSEPAQITALPWLDRSNKNRQQPKPFSYPFLQA